MKQPEVEFFTEDVDGDEYLNVGFKFYTPDSDEPIYCVLGAFGVQPDENGLRIIKALVEEATGYMQGVYSGEIERVIEEPKIETVKKELILP